MNAPEWLTVLDSLGFVTTGIFLSILWQSSIIFMAVALIVYLIRKTRESVKYYLWVTAIILVPVIPILTWGLSQVGTPQKEIPIIPQYSLPSNESFSQNPVTYSPSVNTAVNKYSLSSEKFQDVIYTPAELTDQQPLITVTQKPVRLIDYPWALMLMIYAILLIILLANFIIGRFIIEKWINKGRPVLDDDVIEIFFNLKERLGIKREIIIIENDFVKIPLTCRTIKPVIILPAGFVEQTNHNDLASILLHELAHVSRYDTFMNTVVSVIKVMFFFHPFVWMAAREALFLSESACDSIVVNITEKPVSYANMLAKTAQNLKHKNYNLVYSAGFLFNKNAFLRRVNSILSRPGGRIKKLSKIGIAGITVFAAFSIIVSLAMPLGEINNLKGEELNITGKVLYGDVPVKNAILYLETYDKRNKIFKSVEKIGESGRDGSFSLKIDSSKFKQNYRWAKPSIIAYNPEYSIGWLRLDAPENLDDIIIKLTQKMTVSGIILDMKGNPIDGAEVFVKGLSINRREEKGNGIGSLDEIDNNLIFRSGRDGKFTISNLPVDSQILVRARAKGYTAEYHKGLIDAGTDDVKITLKPEGKIAGKVFYADSGKPAKDVYVLVSGWGSSDHVKTDGNGVYVFENLAAGKYMANVFIDSDFPEWTAEPYETVLVEEGETTRNIDFKLMKGGIVTGKITAADNGDPVWGQEVSAKPSKDFLYITYDTCKTDRNGVYRLRVPPGKAKIYTNSPAGFRKEEKFLLLDVGDSETLFNSDFKFDRGVSVQVAALSPEGVPVGGTSMVDKNTTNIYDHLASDKNGVCIFKGLTPDETLTVYAENSRYKLKGEGEIKIANGAKLEIRMKKYKTNGVGGHVLDQDGNPVKGARLKLIDWKTHISITEFVSKTDADGKYDVDDLIMGNNYNLSVEADGYEAHIIPLHKLFPEEKSDSQPNLLKPDKPVYNVILYKADRWIDAEIVDEDGNPVQGAQVQNQNKTTNMQVLFSDQNGHFRMDKMVPVVENEIFISHKDYGSYSFRLIPTNTKQKFVLHKNLTKLTGILVDKNNKPIAGADISIDKERSESGFVYIGGNKTDAEGKFLFNQVADKEVDMLVTHESFGLKMFHVKTTEGPMTLVFDKPDERKRQEIEFDSRKPVFLDGQKAPELDVAKWLNGSPVKLKDLKGKIVVLGFWTSDEMPWIRAQKALNLLANEYGSKGVVFVEIHENTDDAPKIDKVIKDLGLNYRIAVDKKGTYSESGGKTFDKYGMYRQPDRKELLYHTVIDKKGIAHQNVSLYSLDETIKEFIRGGK